MNRYISVCFVLFALFFFASCIQPNTTASTKHTIAPQTTDFKSAKNINLEEESSEENFSKEFINTLKVSSIKFSHKNFGTDFFVNNSYALNSCEMQICTDQISDEYSAQLVVVCMQQPITNSKLICTNTIEKTDVLLKNYSDEIKLNYQFEIDTKDNNTLLFANTSSTYDLTLNQEGVYATLIEIPVSFGAETKGFFVIEILFSVYEII